MIESFGIGTVVTVQVTPYITTRDYLIFFGVIGLIAAGIIFAAFKIKKKFFTHKTLDQPTIQTQPSFQQSNPDVTFQEDNSDNESRGNLVETLSNFGHDSDLNLKGEENENG